MAYSAKQLLDEGYRYVELTQLIRLGKSAKDNRMKQLLSSLTRLETGEDRFILGHEAEITAGLHSGTIDFDETEIELGVMVTSNQEAEDDPEGGSPPRTVAAALDQLLEELCRYAPDGRLRIAGVARRSAGDEGDSIVLNYDT